MRSDPRGVAVLVADGDLCSLEKVGEVLSGDGSTAILAASAAAALQVLRSQTVDAIVASMSLPSTGGGAFLSRAAALAPGAGRVIMAPPSEAAAVADLLSSGAAHRFLAAPWEPTLLKEAVADVLRSGPIPSATLTRPRTVLLAEDSAALRRRLAALLRVRHQVLEADGGTAALELARLQHPDLVIASGRLEGLSGADLPGLLRGLGLSCPVLIHADPASLNEAARRILDAEAAGVHASAEGILAAADELLAPPPPPRKARAPRPPRAPRGPARPTRRKP